MAIKTTTQGIIPAITLDHIQYTQLNIAVSEIPPHRISLSGKVRLYGVDNDIKYYDKDYVHVNLPDVSAWIASLDPADIPNAMAAMQKIQEGLGILAELKLGITFDSYEL